MTGYRPQTARETIARICAGTDTWVAVGDLIDDWHRSDHVARERMIGEPLGTVTKEWERWAAFIAATVDQLAWESEPRIDPPEWVSDEGYFLREPWFLFPGWRLRMHQLVDTPGAFKRRNIYGGDRILSRA